VGEAKRKKGGLGRQEYCFSGEQKGFGGKKRGKLQQKKKGEIWGGWDWEGEVTARPSPEKKNHKTSKTTTGGGELVRKGTKKQLNKMKGREH